MITEAKVVLKELEGFKRTRTTLFRDSGGIAVGNTYMLDMGMAKTEWRIEKILEVDQDAS